MQFFFVSSKNIQEFVKKFMNLENVRNFKLWWTFFPFGEQILIRKMSEQFVKMFTVLKTKIRNFKVFTISK